MNGPKSHLKGTLCPTSSTWPCCGQLRNSSSSGGGSSGNRQTSWPALVGRSRTTPHCAMQGSGQPREAVSSSCNHQPKVIRTCESFGGGLRVTRAFFLSSVRVRDLSRIPLERVYDGQSALLLCSSSTRLLPRVLQSARLCFTATGGTRATVTVNLSPERLVTYPPQALPRCSPTQLCPWFFPQRLPLEGTDFIDKFMFFASLPILRMMVRV